MSTITAGDYTVEFKVDADGYRHWYNNEYRKPGGDYENQIAPALALKEHIIEKVSKELSEELLKNEEGVDPRKTVA